MCVCELEVGSVLLLWAPWIDLKLSGLHEANELWGCFEMSTCKNRLSSISRIKPFTVYQQGSAVSF